MIENLQGAPLPASLLESSILPARLAGYDPSGLDTLIAAGEVTWAGVEPMGERDGRIALYLADKLPLLLSQRPQIGTADRARRKTARAARINRSQLLRSPAPGRWRRISRRNHRCAMVAGVARPGHQRFTARAARLHLAPGHARRSPPASNRRGVPLTSHHSAKRAGPLVAPALAHICSAAHRHRAQPCPGHATAQSLRRPHARARRSRKHPRRIQRRLRRAEGLEESGRIRRGYFVAGLGATQFALPAAVDMLRQLRTAPEAEKPEFVQMAAADPANPYGSVLRWPDLPVMDEDSESAPRVLTRAAYAEVILRNGQLVAWLRRNNPNLLVFLARRRAGALAIGRGPGALPLRARPGAHARRPTRGRTHHHHQRPARGSTSHGALPHGRRLSSRTAGHALASHSAGVGQCAANSSRPAIELAPTGATAHPYFCFICRIRSLVFSSAFNQSNSCPVRSTFCDAISGAGAGTTIDRFSDFESS